MSIRRVSLFAIAGAAGLFTAFTAIAATETDEDAKTERKVVIIEDGREVEVEGPEAFEFEIPDIAQIREVAGEMAPMIRAFRAGPMMDREDRAEHLREMLQLRPEQEGALQIFIAATTHEPKFEPADFEAMDELTTPERIEKARARMAEHQAAFDKRADAVSRFYAQLSPSQRKVFDKLPGVDGLEPGHHVRMIRFDRDGDVKRFRFQTPRTPAPPEAPKS